VNNRFDICIITCSYKCDQSVVRNCLVSVSNAFDESAAKTREQLQQNSRYFRCFITAEKEQ